jgi:hypothetical protein
MGIMDVFGIQLLFAKTQWSLKWSQQYSLLVYNIIN